MQPLVDHPTSKLFFSFYFLDSMKTLQRSLNYTQGYDSRIESDTSVLSGTSIWKDIVTESFSKQEMVFQWHFYNTDLMCTKVFLYNSPKCNYQGFIPGLYECLREHSPIKLLSIPQNFSPMDQKNTCTIQFYAPFHTNHKESFGARY